MATFWILAGSLFGIVACLVLHFSQHFRGKCCFRSAKSFIASDNLSTRKRISSAWSAGHSAQDLMKMAARDSLRGFNKKSWTCCLRAIGNEKFDFYPFAFLLYLVYLCLIAALLVFKYMYIEQASLDFNQVSLTKVELKMRLNYSYHVWTAHDTKLHVVDWILIYNIIAIAAWESLFNFYRYFSTQFTANCVYSPSHCVVFRHFSIYLFIFVFLCLAQIHFYYLLFPLIILVYLAYNIYCVYAFCSILFTQYKELTNPMMSDVPDEVLQSVYFMRNTSILSCLVSAASLSLFLIVNDINILYYLPTFWLISCITFTLNFVRDRECLYRTFMKWYHCIRHGQLTRCAFGGSSSNMQQRKTENDVEIVIVSDLNTQEKQLQPPCDKAQAVADESPNGSPTSNACDPTSISRSHSGSKSASYPSSMQTQTVIVQNAGNAYFASPKPAPIGLDSVLPEAKQEVGSDDTDEEDTDDEQQSYTRSVVRYSKPTKALSLLGLADKSNTVPLAVHSNETLANMLQLRQMHGRAESEPEQQMAYIGTAYTVNAHRQAPATPQTAGNTPISIQMSYGDSIIDEEASTVEPSATSTKCHVARSSEKLPNNVPHFSPIYRKRTTSDPMSPDRATPVKSNLESITTLPSIGELEIEVNENHAQCAADRDKTRRSSTPTLTPKCSSVELRHKYSASCLSPTHMTLASSSHSQLMMNLDAAAAHAMTKRSIFHRKRYRNRSESQASSNVVHLLVGNGFCSRKSWNSLQELSRFQKTQNISK